MNWEILFTYSLIYKYIDQNNIWIIKKDIEKKKVNGR